MSVRNHRLDTAGRANSLEIGENYASFVHANLVADSMRSQLCSSDKRSRDQNLAYIPTKQTSRITQSLSSLLRLLFFAFSLKKYYRNIE